MVQFVGLVTNLHFWKCLSYSVLEISINSWYHRGMRDKVSDIPNPNFTGQTQEVFMKHYNQNVPSAFPRASAKALLKFKETFPKLFDAKNEWTVDKHRKKFMDWLISYRETV